MAPVVVTVPAVSVPAVVRLPPVMVPVAVTVPAVTVPVVVSASFDDQAANGYIHSYQTVLGGAVDPAALRQGDRVIVLVSGRSIQARSMALVVDDALPAGFEIETVLGPDDAQNGPFRFLGELSGADVQEARDDHFIAAMDLPGRSAFSFAYVARAVTPGDFLLPGALARDMYRPGLNARTVAGRTAISPGS